MSLSAPLCTAYSSIDFPLCGLIWLASFLGRAPSWYCVSLPLSWFAFPCERHALRRASKKAHLPLCCLCGFCQTAWQSVFLTGRARYFTAPLPSLIALIAVHSTRCPPSLLSPSSRLSFLTKLSWRSNLTNKKCWPCFFSLEHCSPVSWLVCKAFSCANDTM